MKYKVEISSIQQTALLAKVVGGVVNDKMSILLDGELGAGKTTFTRYLLQSLGYSGVVSSPTFVLMKHYQVGIKVYHIDAYRLSKEDYHWIEELDGLIIVEWAKNLDYNYPNPIAIEILHGTIPESRIFIIESEEELKQELVKNGLHVST